MAITFTVAAVLVSFLSLFVASLWWSFMFLPSLRLPPGPRPLPIVGNLLLRLKYSNVYEIATALQQKYGPVMTLWVSHKPVIFISGPEVIKEAMTIHGNVFAGRPEFESSTYLTHGHRSLITGYGDRQMYLRKLLVSGVLSQKKVGECGHIRKREVDLLIQTLRNQLGHDNKKGGIVKDFRSMMRYTICNLLVGILFGRRLTAEEHVELDAVMLQRVDLSGGEPRDFMPWLSWLPQEKKGVKIRQNAREKTYQTIEPLVAERNERLQSGQTDRLTVVDTLLKLRDGEIQGPVDILDSDIMLLCMELFNGGTETTALNLEFCMASVINHPEIQEKVAQEISSVTGGRVVEESDLPQLPYLQAVVKESLRRHSPAPLALPRRAMRTTKIGGYVIPADTVVVQHIEAMSLNPEIWEDPLEFRPERFLGKTPDMTASTGEITMIPFGVGRRNCPGIRMAFIHSEFVLARLLQAFQWKSATPGKLEGFTRGDPMSAPFKYVERLSCTRLSVAET